ncbi:MAG: ThiF family adenylyltransferase [Planctomycetales bacterium]|nr:ThiF family adenylyltransferase [Planctomycetales bacterium]
MAGPPPNSHRGNTSDLPSLLRTASVLIVGAGGPGREIARQLVALGVATLTVVDPTVVQPSDICSAGFGAHDVGSFKVDAVGNLCHQANPLLDYTGVAAHFQPEILVVPYVFCCLDDAVERQIVWRQCLDHGRFWADVRVHDEIVSVSTVNDPAGKLRYEERLASEAKRQPSTVPGLVYLADMAASLAVYQLVRHLKGLPVQHEIHFDPATGRYEIADDE